MKKRSVYFNDFEALLGEKSKSISVTFACRGISTITRWSDFGEIRDREKVVRGVKKADSPLIQGYQIYHNFFRLHMALDGRTPASVAGIEILGEDKWQTVIQAASRVPKGRSQTEKRGAA